MIREIERRHIFKDATDREEFLARVARLVPDTQTACYAGVLMPNHVHVLLRTGRVPLPTLMRRLLTGYAVRFSRRHHRHGLLFQNRYHSVVCQEDRYFRELARSLHLTPLRAGLVASLSELSRYPYGGQSALLGKANRPWPATEDVLRSFGTTVARARTAYRAYGEAGIPQGRRADLIGGGLIRSRGGWAGVKERRGTGQGPIKSEERILGDAAFVEAILAQGNERSTRPYDLKRQGGGFEPLVKRVATLCHMDPREVVARGRQQRKVPARSLLCCWAMRELGLPLTVLARQLGLSPPGVSYAVQRGEAIVRENHYELVR